MTHTINLLPLQSAKLKRSQGRSYYQDLQGQRLPNVTSILNATKSDADRHSLARWKQRVGQQQARAIASTASRRGTLTHKHLRHYLLGQPADCPEAALPYWHSLDTVMTDIDDVRLVEGAVFHYDLGYAGKVDCVASYKGVPCVVDWKTSDRPKGSVERLYDQPLQVAAYCGAVNHTYTDYPLTIRSALIVVAVPDQTAEVFWFSPDDLKHYWHQWQTRLEQFYG